MAEKELLQAEAQADAEDAQQSQQLHEPCSFRQACLHLIESRFQPCRVVGQGIHRAVEARDIDAARHQLGFLDHVFAGVVAERRDGVGETGEGVAAERMQAMRGDVADPRREVGFDIP